MLTAIDAKNKKVSMSYDLLGNLTVQTDYQGYTTTYKYDALGRNTMVTAPFEKKGSTTYYTVQKYDYDQASNVVRLHTSNNKPGEAASYSVVEYGYDAMQNLTSVKANDGSKITYTQYAYNTLGNPTRMATDLSSLLTESQLQNPGAGYAVTKYDYDRYGFLSTLTDAMGQSEGYVNDQRGLTTQKTDRNGNVTTYTYDALARLTKSQVVDGNAYASIAYTMTGAIRSESNGTSSSTYTYDSLGRLTTEVTDGATKKYEYNLGHQQTKFTLIVGGTTLQSNGYEYNSLLQLTKVTDTIRGTSYVYQYKDTTGNLETLSYGSANKVNYQFNLANMITSLTNMRGSTTLSSYGYEYRLDGNQTAKVESGDKRTEYTYDGLARLAAERETKNGALVQQYEYEYDSYGNRQTLTATGTEAYTTAYQYDLNNRLESTKKTENGQINHTFYLYDNNGNQTWMTTTDTTDKALATAEQSVYNGFNQLVAVEKDGDRIAYEYFASGLRKSKTADGIKTEFYLDGGNVAAEKLTGTSVNGTNNYIFGLALLSRVDSSGVSNYLFNGHGDGQIASLNARQ